MSDRTPRNRAPQRRPDQVRLVAYKVIRQVSSEDGYANLALNKALRDHKLSGRDAAFCTELVHGTLRWQGTYDVILARSVSRPLAELDPELLDLLRLGTHQLLRMRVDTYAAVNEMVTLTRAEVGQSRSGLVNAVLRKVSQRTFDQWIVDVAPHSDDDLFGFLSIAKAHPRWIVEAFAGALHTEGYELDDLLDADNEPPRVTLVARPGLAEVDDLIVAGATRARYSPYAAVLQSGGDPGKISAVSSGRAGVQDEGSQLVATALATAPLEGRDAKWLDLCAGPGGKAALLAAIGRQRGVAITAVEPLPHRAELVRSNLRAVPGDHKVLVADGTKPTWPEGSYDRVLADVPCSGLGALRRRPEARWRRTAEDVAELRPLQERLLDSAINSVRKGGVVAYVTCTPHPTETREVVDAVLAQRSDAVLEDARPLLPDVPSLGEGPDVQLWPHLHGTDAMYLALIRRT
ncbi:RsmB/NOP family class I SAM-dependent RNA methyltransferase [Kribbella sp. CA-293567]|uniref:RsmB/NOP family class I SAM-dependent RNA methyltransferase n=1 Tax=Kribbella sp. CA-293567 TaxID=3002436 RepID=UPI0022DE3DDE|nr:transcription antitermination factor NusB [Kribbella sp. CA-293567]WBQ08078.1 rRNA cytosine-C5-methyltransferase [Kribbella sp. CA-293567]